MDLQQQLSALANAVRLLERATSGVNAAEPAITAAMAVIGKIVKGLPDDFRREQAWSQARPQVLKALTRAAEVVGKQTYLQMALATPEQAAWAAAYIATPEGVRFSSDMPGAAAARRAEALATGANPAYMPRTVEAFPGSTFTTKDLLFAGSSPDLLGKLQQRVPDDVRALIERVQISGYTLRDWFGKSAVITDEAGLFVAGGQRLGGTTTAMVGGQTVPRWASFSFTSIDRQVRAGFLGGVTNEEVARGLIFDEIRGQMRLGTNAVRLKADARAIARTGLMALSDQAHEAQWAAMEEDLGRPLVLRRRWDSSTDSRICATCSFLDGREWEEPEMPPPRPHPNCVSGDTPVSLGSVVAATRFRYRGDMVAVATASGCNVTVTAQHPMLTARGWVPAIDLRQGDNLIRQSVYIPPIGGAGVDGPDLNQQPPTAEQVFDALLAASPVAPITVPVAPMQFHGDGAAGDGDVDVVFAQRELQDRFHASLGEGHAQIPLIGGVEGAISVESFEAGLSPQDEVGLALNAAANGLVGLTGELLALLRGERSHSDSVRLASAAWLDPEIAEPRINDRAGDTEVLRKCLDALAGIKQRPQVICREAAGALRRSGGFHTSADLHSSLQKASSDCCALAPVGLCDGEGGLTGLVALDDVVDVRVETAPSGGVLVYDFTTVSGTYIVDGLTAHNCRCMVLPVTATELELRRTGDSIHQREKVTAVELTDQEPPKQKANETRSQYQSRMADEGWFLTKGRGPSGERWNRRRVEREGQGVTDWLGAMAKESSGKHSARVSLQEYFGSAKRAEYFRRQVARGTDPRDALQQMLRNVGGADNQASWVPVKQLEQVMPELKGVEPILSTRQQRELAKAARAGGGTSATVRTLERQLAEAREEAAIAGDDGRIEDLEKRLARARANARVPLSRIPRPRRGQR